MRIQPGPDTLNIGKNQAESQMGTSWRYMYLPAKKKLRKKKQTNKQQKNKTK